MEISSLFHSSGIKERNRFVIHKTNCELKVLTIFKKVERSLLHSRKTFNSVADKTAVQRSPRTEIEAIVGARNQKGMFVETRLFVRKGRQFEPGHFSLVG
ncbi:hypothetical protein AAAA78_10555 [Bdellovibrio sp. BCCA]|uniref:hypothetical protein n=1 Tax=Bdellovibrio sp. BCCA TaxID=3136281 RepID=UPI0030F29EC0